MANKKLFFFSFLFLFLFSFTSVSAVDYPNVNLTEIDNCLHPDYSYSFDFSDYYSFTPSCVGGSSSAYNLTYRVDYTHINGSLASGALTMAPCALYYLLPTSFYPDVSTDDTFVTIMDYGASYFEGEIRFRLYYDSTKSSQYTTLLNDFDDITINDSCALPSSPTGNVTDGLVGYWSLDESSGDAIDDTGNQDGTPFSVDYSQTGAATNTGTSYLFTSGDYVNIPNNAIYNISDLSINAWFKTSNNETLNQHILAKGSDTQYVQYSFRLVEVTGSARMALAADFGGTYAEVIDTGCDINDTTWYMGTVTYNSTHVSFYQNGALCSHIAKTGALKHDSGHALNIGELANYNQHFTGNIDEVSLWNKTLNSSEISSYYNSGAGVNFSALGSGSPSSPTLETPILDSSLPNITLAPYENTQIDLDTYFTNNTVHVIGVWYIDGAGAVNITNNQNYVQNTYYNATLYPNNTLKFSSVNENLSVSINVWACREIVDYSPVEGGNCANDSLTFAVTNATGNGIGEPFGFNSIYTIDENYTYINLDYHYDYHDFVSFTINDTNFTSAVGHSSANIANNYSYVSNGDNFNVTLKCWKSNSSTSLFVGDYGYYLDCSNSSQATLWLFAGPNNGTHLYKWYSSDFVIYPDYTDAWIFASNEVNTSNIAHFIVASNITGEVTTPSNFSVPFNVSSFFDAMPKSDDNAANWYFVIITLLIVLCSLFAVFVLSFRLGKTGIYITLLGVWLVAFFLAYGTYLPWAWVIVPPVLAIVFYFGKLLLGGNS